MNTSIFIPIALWFLSLLHLMAKDDPDLEKYDGMKETLQGYIQHKKIIVDICAYEQEWLPDARENSKAVMVMRAVVTHVHCGPAKVGDHLEFIYLIEEPPAYISRHTSTVRGAIKTFFYDPEDAVVQQRQDTNVVVIEGDSHFAFERASDSEVSRLFEKLFADELKTNAKFKVN